MLARFHQRLGHFAVQLVAHHNGNNVDIGILYNVFPVISGFFITVITGSGLSKRQVGIRDSS